MFDYSAYAVTETSTREYTFSDIVGEPSIIVQVAADANPRFLDYRLRQTIRLVADAPVDTKKATDEDAKVAEMKRRLDEDREYDRNLIAGACAAAWGTPPVAADGSQPEFSPEACLAFLRALPNEMFDPFRNFTANIYNFKPTPTITKADADALGN